MNKSIHTFGTQYHKIAGAFFAVLISSEAYSDPVITDISPTIDNVEITVVDTDGFYVGALPYELKIGEQRIRKSKHPDNGDQKILIFLLDKKEFDNLKEQDLVEMGYGSADDKSIPSNTANKPNQSLAKKSTDLAKNTEKKKKYWNMGAFNKSTLMNKTR